MSDGTVRAHRRFNDIGKYGGRPAWVACEGSRQPPAGSTLEPNTTPKGTSQ